MVRICVSIPTETTKATIDAIHNLVKPDLVELRLDYATERLDLRSLRKSTGIPIIGTTRVLSHGGRWGGDEEDRRRLLLSAAVAGFDYIDVEADSLSLSELVMKIHGKGASVIVSRHYLDRTPPLGEILTVHEYAKGAGADIVKVVGAASSFPDNLPYLEYLALKPGNLGFAMGALGILSRVLSPLLGGAFAYASINEDGSVAPGQPAASSLRETYRLMGVAP